MDAFLIDGPAKLTGSVNVSGSKNAALPLLFSSLLFDQEIQFENVPRLWDIETTLKLLQTMGAKCTWEKSAGTVTIDPKISSKVAPYEWVRQMRAGILALGPLVAKYGEARVSLPGGCAIGARPVNFHIEALKAMGVRVDVEAGYIKAQLHGPLKGALINFPEVTVTGTENALMLAAVAEGKTTIENAAREPEVTALGEFLQTCGAKIWGLGTSTIEITGGKLKTPTRPVRVPADRIETGTWISISYGTRSPLTIRNCDPRELTSVIQTYERLGGKIRLGKDDRSLEIEPPEKLEAISIDTAPYPGFPTDMQAQLMANLTLANGRSQIRENIFENRFMHVAELRRLGANIEIDGNTAVIEGRPELSAAPLMATDLRASASLIVAALSAKGTTQINRIYHLDRGYQRLDEKLTALGARVARVPS